MSLGERWRSLLAGDLATATSKDRLQASSCQMKAWPLAHRLLELRK
jgi:hypothetical protein